MAFSTSTQCREIIDMGAAAKKMDFNFTPGEWFRCGLLEPTFDITAEAARKYRERGIWLEGKHWKRDPVGRVIYSRDEITNWLDGK